LEIQRVLLLGEGLLHHSGDKARNVRTDRLVRTRPDLRENYFVVFPKILFAIHTGATNT
jgi:hypothetical protein